MALAIKPELNSDSSSYVVSKQCKAPSSGQLKVCCDRTTAENHKKKILNHKSAVATSDKLSFCLETSMINLINFLF